MIELGRTGMEHSGRDTRPVAIAQRELDREPPIGGGAIAEVAVGVGPPAVEMLFRAGHHPRGAGVAVARADLPPVTGRPWHLDRQRWARTVVYGAETQLAPRVVTPAHQGELGIVPFGAR